MALFWLLLLTAALVAAAADPSPPQTVQDVWAGYDPRALPLEIEVTREWVERGVRYRKFYFTAEVWEGEPARIFAYTAAPVGARRLPAVLHLHGGGQTASLDWLRFWAQRGYAAGTFDFCGPWGDRKEFTLWGKVNANMATAQGGRVTRPDVRHSAWYHWTLAARRMLTVLEQMPEVDRERMGIFGISVGGTLTWMVAGTDARVKAAVPIYGNGWNSYGSYDAPPDDTEDTALWRRTMESQAYAPLITCPVLFMSATNDFHGWMDNGYRTLALVNGPARQVFTPHFNHHIEPDEGRDLPLWMDACLRHGPAFPKTPRLELTLANGLLRALLSPDRPDAIARVRVYYCLGEGAPQGRFWRLAPARRQGDRWQAGLPTTDAALPLRCFANVYYRAGIALSSELARAVPAEMGEARATEQPSLLIDDFARGFADWFFGPAYTDPLVTWTYLRSGEGPRGTKALTVNPQVWGDGPINFELATHQIADPQWRGPAGAILAFWFRGGDPTTLRVKAEEHVWAVGWKTYEVEVKLKRPGQWERVVLSARRFRTKEGEALSAWDQVDRLAFIGQTPARQPPCLARVEWVIAE